MDDLIENIPSLGRLVRLKPVSADEMSDLRTVHETSVRLHSNDMMSSEDVEEWTCYIRSPAYTDKLIANPNIGAFLQNEMVAAASWRPSIDQPDTAKITALFVRPLFATSGIGSRLLEAIEAETAAAGFQSIAIRSFQNATGFFQTKGYRISSYGIRVISPRLSFPVTFMRKALTNPKRSVHELGADQEEAAN
ncbi:MAG: GNAT family N-acetyltransferase [Pseudomonadota bacterium]